MATISITIAALITQIKQEARITGTNLLDDMILALLNEYLLEETYNHRYSEMLKVNQAITLVAAQRSYNLPADFANMRLIRYITQRGYTITLDPRSEYIQERTHGLPKFYDTSSGQLNIFPYQEIVTVDQLLLDYYKVPDQLAADSTPFPIFRLIGPIKEKIIARVLMYNKDLASAQAFTQMGSEDVERARGGAKNG